MREAKPGAIESTYRGRPVVQRAAVLKPVDVGDGKF